MARTLEQLQKQYNTSAKEGRRAMGPRHGPGARGRGGKPKNVGATVSRLLRYVGKYKRYLLLAFLCMILSTVTALLGSYLIAPIIDRITAVVTGKPVEMTAIEAVADRCIEALVSTPFIAALMQNKVSAVTVYVATALMILFCIYLVALVASYVQERMMLFVSQNSVHSIRSDLFEKIQTLPVGYFDKNPTGEVMSRFTNDVDNIDAMLNHSLTSLVSGIIRIVGTFIFMITTNVWLTLITVFFIPILITGASRIGKRSSGFYVAQQAALGAVNGYIEESVTGQKVIKVFNHESACVEEFHTLNEDLRKKQFSAQFWGGIMGPIMGNTSQINYAVTVGVGGVLLCGGMLTPGALTIFAGYSKQFAMPINQISMQMSTIFSALAGAERVFCVLDESPEASADEHGSDACIFGNVTLRDVTFGYLPDTTVLRNISLEAKVGQKIAFVGSTGAGKTTITNLLNRFYDIRSGEILIDGKPVHAYDRAHLRKNIAMVLQDTHLFSGTVRENIRYGRRDATDEEIVQAAKTASAHSFIMRLEHGYDTVLEGDGANLSQGQRQLLNIARAALSKAPILVLDEATSSVDTRTERNIERGMDGLMKNRTTFVIAHRLSTVRNADAIMVLEKGEIIERGTHEELLDLKGRYYELYTGVKELD